MPAVSLVNFRTACLSFTWFSWKWYHHFKTRVVLCVVCLNLSDHWGPHSWTGVTGHPLSMHVLVPSSLQTLTKICKDKVNSWFATQAPPHNGDSKVITGWWRTPCEVPLKSGIWHLTPKWSTDYTVHSWSESVFIFITVQFINVWYASYCKG